MDIVARLLMREEVDSLELELSRERAASSPDFARVQMLKQDIERLERRLAASRSTEQPRRAG